MVPFSMYSQQPSEIVNYGTCRFSGSLGRISTATEGQGQTRMNTNLFQKFNVSSICSNSHPVYIKFQFLYSKHDGFLQ